MIRKVFKNTFLILSTFVLTFFYQFSFPTLHVSAAKTTDDSIKYMCAIDGSDIIPDDVRIEMNITPNMTLPEEVEENTDFEVTNVSADIGIDLTGILDDLRALINPFNGHANEFNVDVDGEAVNVVGKEGVSFPETPHAPEDDAIEFTVEALDYTVTAEEDDVEIKAGSVNANIESSLATLTVTCNPEEETTIATVPVVAADEDENGEDEDENGEGEDEENGEGEDEENGEGEDEENGEGEDEENGEGEDDENGETEEENGKEPEEEEKPELAESIEYACTVQDSAILGDDVKIKMVVSPTMTLPKAMKPESQYTITDIETDISIDLTGVLNDLRALINPFKGHANSFLVDAGENKGINVVGDSGVSLPETPHSDSDDTIDFTVKGNDSKVISGKEGNAEVHVDNINVAIESSLATLTVTCDPVKDANTLVGSIPLSDDGVGEEITETGSGSGSGTPGSGGGGSGSGDGGQGSGGSGEGKGPGAGQGSGLGSTGSTGSGASTGGSTLPKTATNNPLIITVGAMLVAFGGAMTFVRRRRNTISQ